MDEPNLPQETNKNNPSNQPIEEDEAAEDQELPESPTSDGDEEPNDEPSQDDPETPGDEPSDSEDPDEEDDFQPSFPAANEELPTFDPSTLPVGEDGLVDLNALGQQFNETIAKVGEVIERRVSARTEAVSQERQAWDKAFEKYPELRKDTELRNDIQSLRAGRLYSSGGKEFLTPKQAADRYFKRFGKAKEEGIEQAHRNTRIQKSAYTDSGTRRADPTQQKMAKLNEQASSRDRATAKSAQAELLKMALFPDK